MTTTVARETRECTRKYKKMQAILQKTESVIEVERERLADERKARQLQLEEEARELKRRQELRRMHLN